MGKGKERREVAAFKVRGWSGVGRINGFNSGRDNSKGNGGGRNISRRRGSTSWPKSYCFLYTYTEIMTGNLPHNSLFELEISFYHIN